MNKDFTKKSTLIIKIGLLIALLIIVAIPLLPRENMRMHNQLAKPDENNWDYRLALTPFAPALRGYSILIDLDNLVLVLYKNAIEVKSWPVSGGTVENPSPVGSWLITEIENWGAGFGGSWIALNVPWGIYGIHGTRLPRVVGKGNISHGCIRMKNSDVAELKEIVSVGVPVHIKYDKIPFRELSDGNIGSDVLKLQIMLKKLKYYPDIPNGKFDTSTYKALCQFQADEKIKVDGILGIQTWNKLKKRLDESL